MKVNWYSKFLLAIAIVAFLAGGAFAQMIMDLDDAPGDQGVREGELRAGKSINIELIATEGAKDLIAFEVQLRFDTDQIRLRRFKADELFEGGLAIPGKIPGGATVSVALLGRHTEDEAGTLGYLRFTASDPFGPGVKIELVKATLGATDGGKTTVELSGGVRLMNPDAEHTGDVPGPPGMGHPPSGNASDGDQRRPPPPDRQRPTRRQEGDEGQARTPGQGGPMGPPGQGGGHDDGPSPEEVQSAIDQLPPQLQGPFNNVHKLMMEADRLRDEGGDWKPAVEKGIASIEAAIKAMGATKKVLANATPDDRERVAKFLQTIHDGPDQPGGEQDLGKMVDEIIADIKRELKMLKEALATGVPPKDEDHHDDHGPGPGGQRGMGPGQGRPMGPPGQGGPMGPPGQGGGHDDGPSPEEVQRGIDQLPSQLQGPFNNAHKLMMEADRLRDEGGDWKPAVEKGIASIEAAIKAMGATKEFMANATPDDRERVAKFFQTIHDGPDQPGGEQDFGKMVDEIIADIKRPLKILKEALATGVPPKDEDHRDDHGPGPGGQSPGMGPGQGGQQGPSRQGRPMGPPGQGGPMGPPGQGEHRGQGPQDDFNPAEAIQKLPEDLQPAFKRNLDAKRKLKRSQIGEAIEIRKNTLGMLVETKSFLAEASDEDQKAVLEVLRSLIRNKLLPSARPDNHREGPGGPMPPPEPGGPQTGNMGGDEGGGPEGILKRMIEHLERRIESLNRALQEMGP